MSDIVISSVTDDEINIITEGVSDADIQAALTAATAAQTAQTAAEVAKTAAELAQSNAETAKTNAEIAETNAGTQATASAASATASASSASSASTYATNAASSATEASNYATTASGHATTANVAATNAVSARDNAQTYASNASTSATEAATSASQALAAKNSINQSYLGVQASNPINDLLGNPVTIGDWYYNSTFNTTRIYDGSTWQTTSVSPVGFAQYDDTVANFTGALQKNGVDVALSTDISTLDTNKIDKVASTDNAIPKFDGTTGKLKNTGITIDDSNNITTSGTVDGRDISTDGTKLDIFNTSSVSSVVFNADGTLTITTI